MTQLYCNKQTKNKTQCKKSINCKVHGSGIYSTVKRFASKLVPHRLKLLVNGPRKGPTKRFTKFLDDTQNERITSIQVVRKPILTGVKLALDIMSGGHFSQKQKDLKYDQVYHNYMIVGMGGKYYKIEKNHVIEFSEATKSDFNHEIYTVPLGDANLTLKDMIAQASKRDSQSFFQYSGNKNNCQKFVQDLVEDNDLHVTDEKAIELIEPQRADLLIGSLGNLSGIPRIITDTAAIGDRLYHGDGLKMRTTKLKSRYRI
jgi:hypothetical protein